VLPSSKADSDSGFRLINLKYINFCIYVARAYVSLPVRHWYCTDHRPTFLLGVVNLVCSPSQSVKAVCWNVVRLSQTAEGIKSKLKCKAASLTIHWMTWNSQLGCTISSPLCVLRNSRDCLSSIYCIRFFHCDTETRNLTQYTNTILYGSGSAYAGLTQMETGQKIDQTKWNKSQLKWASYVQ
jgi:hypothetical protein